MASDAGTERKSVKTYIPSYQKSEWASHAERLDMSQSEFIRCMVQAGRQTFEADREEDDFSNATPRGDDLKDRIQNIIAEEPCEWDTLIDRLTQDLEEDVEEAVEGLLEEGTLEQRLRGTLTIREE